MSTAVTTSTSTRVGLVKPTAWRSPLKVLLANAAITLPMFDAGQRFVRDYLSAYGHVSTGDPSRPYVDTSSHVAAGERSASASQSLHQACQAIDGADPTMFGGLPASTVLIAWLIDERPLSAISAGLLNRSVSDKTLKHRLVGLLERLASHYQRNGRSHSRTEDSNGQ